MTLKFLTAEELKVFAPQILEMLRESDREFVPPLSARSSTTQQDLEGGSCDKDGIILYYEQMMTQNFLAAVEGQRLLAFVSFISNHVNETVTQIPNIYLSTLVMRRSARGKGLTKQMYQLLFRTCAPAAVYTRTWSTNTAHLRILEHFGFETIRVLKDHRGEGIDTVYLKLRRQ